MGCSQKQAILALAVMATSSVAFGQVFSPGPGDPYGYLGLGGTDEFSMYQYDSSPQWPGVANPWSGVAGPASLPPVTVSNVSGNPTEAAMANVYSGPLGTTGMTMFSDNTPQPVVSTTASLPWQSNGLLYLKSSIATNPPPGAAVDANGHGAFNVQIGFVDNPASWIAGGNTSAPGMYMAPVANVYSGTTGVFLDLNVGNNTATTNNPLGGAWTTPDVIVVGQPPVQEPAFYFIAPNAVTEQPTVTPLLTNVSSGTTATSCGTPYNGVMEVSEKLIPDSTTPGNYLLRVKMGSMVTTVSFNADNPLFGSTPFNPATAVPMVYLGSGSLGTYTQDIGILPPGDANGDGKVNLADFNILRQTYGATDATWSQGDFSQTGQVNLSDFNVLRQNFGTTLNTYTSPAVKAQAQPATPHVQASGSIDLLVNTTTGDVQLQGLSTSLSSYEIDSASGSLIPANWKSLASQSIDGYGTFGATTKLLSEGTLGSGPSLPPTIDLGDLFAVGGAHDLVWTSYDNSGNENDDGNYVSYVGTPEPASLALLAVGAMGLMARRRQMA